MYYYKSNVHLEHSGFYDLKDISLVVEEGHKKMDDHFQISLKLTDGRTIYLLAGSREESDIWMDQLRVCRIF